MLYLGRGLSNAVMFGPGEVVRYGVPGNTGPARHTRNLLLRGDPLRRFCPAFRGVGEKTAATMLAKVRIA